MTIESFTNFADTTLNGTIINTDLPIVVTDGSLFPAANFYIVIDWNNSSREIVHIATRSTNTLTADLRGAEGTTAVGHTTGAKIIHGWLARHSQEWRNNSSSVKIFKAQNFR